MIFSKKRREEKKRQKELLKQQEEKAQQIRQEIADIEEKRKDNSAVLEKELIPAADERESSLFKKFKKGLTKTRKLLIGNLSELSGEESIDDDFLEDLEESLLGADLGYVTSEKILEAIERKVDDGELKTHTDVIEEVKQILSQILDQGDHEMPSSESGPTVYLFVGVNGVGKTTAIGKLASKLKGEGKKVLVAAGDTFRAAAIEQLERWAERSGVDIVARSINSDPSATMYEAAEKAVEGNYDVLLCDTSGRLHTKKNLMDELYKMQKVIKKVIPDAPHASVLVLDANTGQNAIVQTKEFSSLIGLDGLIVTKLDGTAKGGVIIGIVNEFEIPVYYIGVGEGIDDLEHFSPKMFADSLFD